ncbi:MAG: AraC family transcriptional regulator [Treponema sp.]|jgi:AraC-like DNA-binding protein|nr:AraC family transcriptional regulator [Treponema sp.]
MEQDFSALPLTRVSSRYSLRQFPLHALTVLSGHSRETSAAYYNDGRREADSYAVWQYTIAGRGRIDLKEKSLDLSPGSLMVVSVPGPQVYYLPEDSPYWEFAFLVLIGREAIRITRMIEKYIGRVIDASSVPHTVARFYNLLEKLFSGGIQDPFKNSAYSYNLCMTFLEENTAAQQAGVKHPFGELKDFLRSNIFRDISVAEMADVMHLSRSHFTRIFSQEMGISPRLYLEDLRLRTAMDILFREGSSVKEAAIQCGIPDVNYFCRLFKKRFGISPGKYREGSFPATGS